MNAIMSHDLKYRYYLERPLPHAGRPMTFVMLNPSTADAQQDDPTIRRCLGFANRERSSILRVVNLFAYRATDPKKLVTEAIDPVGPDNEGHVFAACTIGKPLVIAAWGTQDMIRVLVAADYFKALAKSWGVELYALGVTKDGNPRHPLYLRGDSEIRKYQEIL